jgi:S1-C subfamily serine protease
MRIVFIVLAIVGILQANITDDMIKQSIVKIYTVAKLPDYKSPWSATTQSFTGSGSIIKGDLILTNAHVVANQAFLEVQKYGERKKYIAKVYAVSHQADLALLKVEDKKFFEGVTPLELGPLPQVEQRVVVLGYPMGGNTLSATLGVVSRIEDNMYVHSTESFLAIQVDAAINPGNSGGPAISGGKIVGVAMQGITLSQNIGYLVPTPIIKHFLDDMKDGHYDGFADLGIDVQRLENPAIRDYYGLDDNQTGILIDKVVFKSALNGLVKPGDILTAIDNRPIQNDGTVEFREHEFTHYNYFIDLHQMGDKVKFSIIRDEKPLKITATLKNKSDDLYLVKTTRYDKMPTYSIFGGYVFTPLTRNLISSTKANRNYLSYLASRWQSKDKEEVVVLLKVLASKISRGNNGFGMWPIDTINGKKFKNFKEFDKLLRSLNQEYIILADKDGHKVIINKNEAIEQTPQILQKYNIEYDRSIDLR